ncbi:hypothetical protein TNCV_1965251 [Trichonephila clavipes]|nr:hypothetical protein TNCV_1965251 [Trichonephila clavipes]
MSQGRHPETMNLRKYLSPHEIANLFRELSENDLDGDVIDNIPVNPDTYIARDGTDWSPHNSKVPSRFVTRNFYDKALVHQTSRHIMSTHLRMAQEDTGAPNEGATCAWMAADEAVGCTSAFHMMWRS